MIWIVVLSLTTSAICAVTMCYCVSELVKTNNGSTNAHDRCHEQVQSMLQMSTVRAEAQALRRAANLWDSVEEAHNIKVLARENFAQDGPSLPTLWLRQQATKLDGKTHD